MQEASPPKYHGQYKPHLTAIQIVDTGALVLEVDYLDEASILAAMKAIEPDGRLDVLVNNGGEIYGLVRASRTS